MDILSQGLSRAGLHRRKPLRAALGESTEGNERAAPSESTELNERADIGESAEYGERAAGNESTVLDERAEITESTETGERKEYSPHREDKMKSRSNEVEWISYFKQMRAYNEGKRQLKPRTPLQYGTHIESLPQEYNDFTLPQNKSPCLR